MTHATSTNTITALRHIFSYFGLPEHLVTDNGTQFTSDEFQKFLRENDILHTLTAPGHPATNGLAERYVGEFKDKLGKIGDTGESVQTKLDRFLLTYRATPITLGKSPSELLMNRQPRIRFSALRAKSSKQEVKVFQDNLDNKPQFTPNQAVFVRNFGKGAKWIPGTIVEVQVEDIIWKRHQEQLLPRFIPSTLGLELAREPQLPEQTEGLTPVMGERPVTTPTLSQPKEAMPVLDTPAMDSMADAFPSTQDSSVRDPELQASAPEQPERRYPLRERKTPQRLY